MQTKHISTVSKEAGTIIHCILSCVASVKNKPDASRQNRRINMCSSKNTRQRLGETLQGSLPTRRQMTFQTERSKERIGFNAVCVCVFVLDSGCCGEFNGFDLFSFFFHPPYETAITSVNAFRFLRSRTHYFLIELGMVLLDRSFLTFSGSGILKVVRKKTPENWVKAVRFSSYRLQ